MDNLCSQVVSRKIMLRDNITDLERERLVLFELDEKDGLLAMYGHELALCIPGYRPVSRGHYRRPAYLQTPAIETRHEIGYALAFNADIRRQDIIAYGQSSRNDDNL